MFSERRRSPPSRLRSALGLRRLRTLRRGFGALRRRRRGGVRRLAFALLHGDARAVGEAREAGRDDLLLRLQAVGNHRARVVLQRDRDRPHRDLAVGLDHVDERALRSALHGGGRHHHHALQGIDQQADIDELPRPELQVLVREFRLHADRAGRLIHLVVDHPQLAAIDECLSVHRHRVDIERAAREGLVDLRKLLLRQVEQHRDGPDLRDHHDAVGVVRLYQIAFVDQPQPGAPVERRDDPGVAKHRLGIVDRRLIALHLSFELRHQRLLGVGLLFRSGVGGGEPVIAVDVEARVGERRLVLRLLGDRLIVLRLIDARIDLGEHIAALDVLAFLEMHLDDLPADLRAHRDGIERAGIADRIEIDRHVRDAGARGQHRRGLVLERARALGLLFLLLLAVVHIAADGHDDGNAHSERQDATRDSSNTFVLARPPDRPPIRDLIRQHPAAAERLEQADDRLQAASAGPPRAGPAPETACAACSARS